MSYLVNMTRPDLAFSFFQLSKFLQCPGDAYLAAAYRFLAYVTGTLNQGLSYHDPGVGKRNTLSSWLDSDFASDIDTRKSVRAASQAGQEVLYLRALLKGFAYLQHGPTEIWEDNARLAS